MTGLGLTIWGRPYDFYGEVLSITSLRAEHECHIHEALKIDVSDDDFNVLVERHTSREDESYGSEPPYPYADYFQGVSEVLDPLNTDGLRYFTEDMRLAFCAHEREVLVFKHIEHLIILNDEVILFGNDVFVSEGSDTLAIARLWSNVHNLHTEWRPGVVDWRSFGTRETALYADLVKSMVSSSSTPTTYFLSIQSSEPEHRNLELDFTERELLCEDSLFFALNEKLFGLAESVSIPIVKLYPEVFRRIGTESLVIGCPRESPLLSELCQGCVSAGIDARLERSS